MKRFVFLTLGSFLFAYGFALFIEPVEIAPGGLTGIVVIISRLNPSLNTGYIFLLLNTPLLVTGAIVFGINFFLKTMYTTIISSIIMTLASRIILSPIIPNVIVMTFIGSLICGIGLALVIKADATTGGTDIIAKLIHNRFARVRLGWIFFIIDAVVILIYGAVFMDWKKVLYSAFSAAIIAFVLNYFLYLNFFGNNIE